MICSIHRIHAPARPPPRALDASKTSSPASNWHGNRCFLGQAQFKLGGTHLHYLKRMKTRIVLKSFQALSPGAADPEDPAGANTGGGGSEASPAFDFHSQPAANEAASVPLRSKYFDQSNGWQETVHSALNDIEV
jgi:hypothetical protein